jgi:hypothetical protein
LLATVLRLDNLRSAATHEFELTGPFPSGPFSRIMDSTNKMLDAFHAMNVVVQKNLQPSPGEIALLKHTADERSQLCARISHLFQVLASSLKLEYPLSDAVPSTGNARDRLLARIFQYRREVGGLEEGVDNGAEVENGVEGEGEAMVVAKDEDYELLYAYILVTGQLSEEISKVERIVEELFGVMDEDMIRLQ